ncbi:hypothetical protein HOY80DRAFT_1083948 [Tuber brumale]|nr:hypothetical protein HOY80DRAFT_1083948 [Tuber brumale]
MQKSSFMSYRNANATRSLWVSFDPSCALTQETHTDYWIAILNHCKQATPHQSSFVLFERPVLYYDTTAKKAALKRTASNNVSSSRTAMEAEDTIRDYSNGSTLMTFSRQPCKQGILAVFINEIVVNAAQRAAKQAGSTGKGEDWHAYAVFHSQGHLKIFDPSWIYDACLQPTGDMQPLRNCEFLPLIRRWVENRERRLPAVRSIEICGGVGLHGPWVLKCQERTRNWILKRWLEEDMRNLGNLEDYSVGATDQETRGNNS